MKACSKKTPKTPNPARVNISHPRPHPRHGRMCPPRTRQDHRRPRLRHRRLLPRLLRLPHQTRQLPTRQPNQLIWYVGPTEDQAAEIAWDRLKEVTAPYWSHSPNEDKKRVYFKNGSRIQLKSAFKTGKLRGSGVDFVVFDESALIDPRAWTEGCRPALSDRKGRALFIGTPKGRDYFYDLYERAISGDPEWAGYRFTTLQGGIIDQAEIDSLSHDLDPETFRQEIEASFNTIGHHKVYKGFNRAIHIQPVTFENLHPIVWALDFNVNPMCMLLMQRIGDEVRVLEEIVIRPEAHTEMACDVALDRLMFYYKQVPVWQRPLTVKVYGDASGGQRRTAGARTDWTIIKDFFTKWVGDFSPEFRTTSSNPPVRDRINCVKARLLSQAGDSRLFIHPQCKELIRDLEEVAWATDATGAATDQLNKSDRNRTHTSDALGYFIYQEFPMLTKIGEKGKGPILSF